MTSSKYPSSAGLFQFCRLVLDHKFGGIRVIDQDVGQILGFDPADCSHWKNGKKNIRSIQAVKTIANHLGVDEKLIVDIASGDLDYREAFNEYHGYGMFNISSGVLDSAKKDYYRRHAAAWDKNNETEFKLFFNPNVSEIERIVSDIHQKINLTEAPLYLPEVAANYPELRLVGDANYDNDDDIVQVKQEGGNTTITFKAGTEVQPYMRYRIARAMAQHFLGVERFSNKDFDKYADHALDVTSNIFAAKLLIPAMLVRKELQSVDVAKDIVSQLSESFWVSKNFMNRCLKELLLSTS
ncbi:MAG: hypothetical protein OYH77_04685 [Pseudomonadota bacterium]|nr:hypothetical protein [Pseudomonadota bacterium]